MARTTLAQYALDTDARLARIEAGLERLIAAQLDPKAPARNATRKVTRKVAKPKAVAKPTKGAQTRETLSRKEWNRTLTAKARLAGRYDTGDSVYAYVLANWDEAQTAREAGMTPDEFLAGF